MSIGELVNLYREEELDVHPEFQRIFRWTDGQKTRLIESLLLGIPIPPIFVAQKTDGVWDVVDGVQRISTILQFMGELRDVEGKPMAQLVLEKTKFLPSLKGKYWKEKTKRDKNAFTRDQQLYIKRARIDVNIVKKESDEKSKYELFMRLNTGGSPLAPQEVRNCLMVMAYPETYEWLRKLCAFEPFMGAISLSDRAIDEQYHMELATRFLAFRKLPEERLSEVGDIGDFLNDHLESLHDVAISQKKRKIEERAFKATFRLLYDTLVDDAFHRYDIAKRKFLGGFLISAFEAVALGIGYNVADDGDLPEYSNLIRIVEKVWSNQSFNKYSGSGVKASVRIPKIVPLGRKIFSE